jgi:hypothetical protein
LQVQGLDFIEKGCNNITMKIYTRKHLSKALDKANLPSSPKALSEYEAKGIIPRGGSFEIVNRRNDRFYTQEEIAEIVEKVRQYKNG